MSLSQTPDNPFAQKIIGIYGSDMGGRLYRQAVRYLTSWGIDVNELKVHPEQGTNANIFTYKDTLLIKVRLDLEELRRYPLDENPLILRSFKRANIGYDQTQVSIGLKVYPLLKIRSRPEHVQAVTQQLYKRYGFLFRDNKVPNVFVTLDSEGNEVPMIIDAGSVIEVGSHEKSRLPFMYPENSGFLHNQLPLVPDGDVRTFPWIEKQAELPEIKAAREMLDGLERAAAGRVR